MLASWAFLVVFGSLTAFTIYLYLIREWGPARAGLYTFVSPVIALALGSAVLGESLTPLDLLGTALILAGAWIAFRTRTGG